MKDQPKNQNDLENLIVGHFDGTLTGERFRAVELLYLPESAVLGPPENEKCVSDFC